MISFLNAISSKWFSWISNMSIQLALFFMIIFLLAYLFRGRSAKFLYGLWSLMILKAILPPSIPSLFQNNIELIPQIHIPIIFPVPVTPQAAVSTPTLQPISYLFIAWLLMIVFLSVFIITKNVVFRSNLRYAQPVNESFFPQSVRHRFTGNNSISVYVNDHICAPFTLNGLRPSIYLPRGAWSWNQKKLEAILLHEMAHIQRKDLWMNLMQTIVQILYFFHPMVWFANWQVNHTRERACDDVVLSRSDASSLEYSKFLLSHVRQSLRLRECPSLMNSFHQNRKALMRRFEYLVNRKEGIMLSFKKTEKSVLVFLCCLAFGFTIFNSGLSETMAENITSQIKEGYGQVRGKILGEPHGEPIQGVRIRLEGTTLSATSSPNGEYVIKEVPPGIFTVKASRDEYRSVIVKNVKVKKDQRTKINFELKRVDVQSAPSSPFKKDTEGKQFVAYDTPPKPIGGFAAIQQNLDYPESARKAGIEGRVIVQVQVDEQGNVADTKIAKSLGDDQCDRAAVEAIKKTEWKPALQKDTPVKVWVSIPVLFRLKNTEEEKTLQNGRSSTLSNEQDERKTIEVYEIDRTAERPEKIPPTPDSVEETPMFVPYDTPPKPVGGFAAIQKNLYYPELARKARIEGTVILQVLVDTNGEIVRTKVAKSLGENNGCNEAAMAAIKKTEWTPALRDKKPVNVWVSIPVIFKLAHEETTKKEKTSKESETSQKANSPDGITENYPNPFNPATTIHYSVPKKGNVVIRIFNNSGQLIRTLIDQELTAGDYTVQWDGLNSNHLEVASGQYFYQIKIDDKVLSKKMLKIK